MLPFAHLCIYPCNRKYCSTAHSLQVWIWSASLWTLDFTVVYLWVMHKSEHWTLWFLAYVFQRMDLGECSKIHDLALRADYEIASKERDLFFELDVSNTPYFFPYCIWIHQVACPLFISTSSLTDLLCPSGCGPPGVLHRGLRSQDGTGQEEASGDARGDQRWGGSQGKCQAVCFGSLKIPLYQGRNFIEIVSIIVLIKAFCNGDHGGR